MNTGPPYGRYQCYPVYIPTSYFSTWSVVKSITKEEGPAGFFRGLSSTWAREAPGYFFFFAGYECSRKLLTPRNHKAGDDLGEVCSHQAVINLRSYGY